MNDPLSATDEVAAIEVPTPPAAEFHDDLPGDTDAERYRLVSIESVHAPEGCVGQDWFVYRISRGGNAITGYRRGKRATVAADVATIVAGLNGRREWSKNKASSQAKQR